MDRKSKLALFISVTLAVMLCVRARNARGQANSPANAPKELTVERIYGSPSLSGHLTAGIEWNPNGEEISYLGIDSDDEPQMWSMDATTGERKVLVKPETLQVVMQPERTKAVQSTGLGRVQPENYFWAPDGSAILFAGSTELVLLDLKTMTPKSLVSGNADVEDPKFSPDGKWVSFVRDFNLWLVNTSTGEMKALTTGGSEEVVKGGLDWVYPEELDATTAYWWSPDSSKIAYYQMDERPVTRYPITDMSSPAGEIEYTRFPLAGGANPIVRVGVVSIGGGETKWMDTGADTDIYLARVAWLNDSSRVAIERLNRAQNRLDLLFCDALKGTSQPILSETDKYWVNLADDLYFFSDNKRFLWSSERTGFRHFYVYDINGKQLDQLTSGDWAVTGEGGFGPGAVEHPAVDEARGYIYFLSNKDDVHDTQLYRLSMKDKSITRITREPGVHDALVAPDETGFVDRYSNTSTPARQQLVRLNPQISAGGPAVIPINDNPVPELAEYHLSPLEYADIHADDGTRLCTSMIKPAHFDPSKKYPVLIYVYGGPQDQEVRNEWGGADFLWHEMMAEKGYIVFTLDNRGMYNRGHAFETPIFHRMGKVELEDQLAGVKYLKSLPYVDGARIGIWGWSYGGYMTLDAMFNAPEVFKAGISVAPVSDWKLYDTIYTERYMGKPQDNAEGYENSSPVNQVANLKGRLMLVAGTGDDNVHFANTAAVINDLVASGNYPADLMIFPGRGHGMNDRATRIQLFQRMTQFLLNNL
jgi:dipeptidyl-peptidase-4